jgi:hypothetical protein
LDALNVMVSQAAPKHLREKVAAVDVIGELL